MYVVNILKKKGVFYYILRIKFSDLIVLIFFNI